MLNDLSYGIKIWTDLSSVLSQSTRLTDKILITRPRLYSMQRRKNLAIVVIIVIYLCTFGQRLGNMSRSEPNTTNKKHTVFTVTSSNANSICIC